MRTKDEIIEAQSRKIAALKSNLKGVMKARELESTVTESLTLRLMNCNDDKLRAQEELRDWKKGNGVKYQKTDWKEHLIYRFGNVFPISMFLIGFLIGRN